MSLALFWTVTLHAQHHHKAVVPIQQRILQQVDQNDSVIKVTGASDTVVPYLLGKQERLSLAINQIGTFYQHGFDTIAISIELPTVEAGLARFKDFLATRGQQMNLRSLNSFLVLMSESTEKLKGWQNTLNGYSQEMNAISGEVENIVDDSTIKTLPADSALYQVAVQELRIIDSQYKQVDSLQRTGFTRIGLLQKRVEMAYLAANDISDEVNYRIKHVKEEIWNREENELWGIRPAEYKTNLFTIIGEGFSRAYRVIGFYMTSTWDTRSINLVVLVVLVLWTWANLFRIKRKGDKVASLAPVHFLRRSILVGCIVLVMTFGAFLETNIPMSYLHFTGILELIGLGYLLYPYLTREGRRLGLWLAILWVGYAIDDLLGETAYLERWLLVAGAIASLLLCYRLLRSPGKLLAGITYPSIFRSLVVVTTIFSTLSLGFNVAGRTTLSKLFGLTGIHSLMYAALLWVSSTIVLEIIYMQSEAYKESRFSAFLNFTELRKRFQFFLRLFSGLFWLIMFTRNMSIFEPLYELTADFIAKQRTLGSITFSFGSVFVFLLIIWIASFLSQFINFLFGSGQEGRKGKMGTMALIVRLGVLTIGFLIAVGAAGIPLEKISFIIGALGVGIGFGLQTIVNNLVSGIILAFERPIQVGDQIEVAGRSGIVKEIGIRASKISNFEGADIIIPNGDLLSQHLVNWTLSNRNRRVEVRVRVDQASDVAQVTDVLKGVLSAHKDIMSSPGPSVLISGFAGNWVEFQLLFWAEDLGNTGSLTHAVISELKDAFTREKIRLVNPAQDIYVRETGEKEM
ncbi:mechanosensitive ion channel family protein [Dinghuibacter silviterrae]|nr:mechanosensitive ion channel domain-containing protein [Dinghuibacter silviterrae]